MSQWALEVQTATDPDPQNKMPQKHTSEEDEETLGTKIETPLFHSWAKNSWANGNYEIHC